jgi:transcriptional regulator with XRE-family HTH domain
MCHADGEKCCPMDHEGERIKQLLAARGRTAADLARATGVTATAVGRYIYSRRLGPKAWATASRGLVALGIDPDEIRPTTRAVAVDWRELRDGLDLLTSPEQLAYVKRLLEAAPQTREIILALLDDRLSRSK